MSKVYSVAVLVGSLRKDSLNRKVAHALAQLAPPHLKLNIVEIGELALYNEGSRPYGQSVFSGKPGAVISVSPGAIGGFGANHHLRQSLVFLNVPCMQQPEAYLGGAGSAFDEAGQLSEKTRPFLQAFIDAYSQWVETVKGV